MGDNAIAHVMLAASWIAWCVFHSVLIASSVTRRLRGWLGGRYAYFRLAYVLISVLTLAPLLWWQWRLPSPLIVAWTYPWTILQWAGLVCSGIIMYLGARQYNQRFFFGIQQIQDHREGRNSDFSGFEEKGILSTMRHPYYTSGILFLLFWGDISVASLIFKVIGILYLLIGAVLEEKKLVAEYGDMYRHYQRRVPMFFPLPWGKRTDHTPPSAEEND